jgi:hypothetical protein
VTVFHEAPTDDCPHAGVVLDEQDAHGLIVRDRDARIAGRQAFFRLPAPAGDTRVNVVGAVLLESAAR